MSILSLVIILLDFRSGVVLLLVSETVDPANTVGGMVVTEGLDMVLERALVLEIRATNAIPKLSTILLMSSPVPSHGERLTAFAAREWLEPMLALVMCLESSKVFEWLGSRVVDVIAAPWRAAVARQP